MGFHDSLVPLVVCAVLASKVPTQEKVYEATIKVSHSVVAVGTVCDEFLPFLLPFLIKSSYI